MKNILLFVNPKSRQGEQYIQEIEKWLYEHGFHIIPHQFDPKKEKMKNVISRYAAQDPIVLVGGGDGSINEALPGLIDCQLPLLVIPLGTANNLARTLGIPSNFSEALQIVLQNNIRTVDVGLANKIPFINVIGLGLSTQVNRFVRSETKRWLGVFAFILTALKVALRMTPFRIRVEYDGQTHHAFTWQVTICNGRNYGSGLTIHEDASLQDQTLHGLSTEVKKWWHAFVLVPALLSGKYKSQDKVTIFEGKTMRLQTHHPMHVDIDGDIKTSTPLEVSVLPRALRVFVPHGQEKI